jgi:WD40 repeat protein
MKCSITAALALAVAGLGASVAGLASQEAGRKPALGKDRYGDPLPEGTVARLGSARFWSDCGWVHAVSFASGGKRLVTFGRDRKVRVWDVANGKELRSFNGAGYLRFVPAPVLPVPISPDGKRVAFRGLDGGNLDDRIHVHDPDSGEEIADFKVGTLVYPFAFSPDGKALAAVAVDAPGVAAGAVVVYEIPGGKERAHLELAREGTAAVAFSPDGKTLAVAATEKGIALWDVEERKKTVRLPGHEAPQLDVAFSDDGKTLISAGRDQKVRTWDPSTGKETSAFDVGRTDRAFFSGGGRMVSVVGPDNSLVVWDVASGKKLRAWPGQPPQHGLAQADVFLSARFSPPGASWDRATYPSFSGTSNGLR